MVDVDWYVEDDQPKYDLIVDREKAALNGISDRGYRAHAAGWRLRGRSPGLLHDSAARKKTCRSTCASRAPRVPTSSDLQSLKLRRPRRQPGRAWRNRAHRRQTTMDKSIYHKNLHAR